MERRNPVFPEALIRSGLRVPMRDGVGLATDLYLPAQEGHVVGPQPALLLRTPYNRAGAGPGAIRLARHGYVVAVQDVRGRYESEGDFAAFLHEDVDGYDAVEWLAALPECDGRVGTYGGSYSAAVQGALATQAPPHLACMCHYFGYPHLYHSLRQGGALDVFYLSYLWMMAGDGKEALADPSVRRALYEVRFDEWLERWPFREGQTPLALAPSYERLAMEFARRECLDAFWRQPSLCPAEHLEQWPDVPTLWVCGWYDHYAYAHPDTLAFTRLTELGHRNQYAVFGPWTHGDTGLRIGETTLGAASTLEARLPDYELRWFDRWLKGIDDEGLFGARAQYFVMGGGTGDKTREGLLDHGGVWQEGDCWPPQATEARWPLGPAGRLVAGAESDLPRAATVSYTADPAAPAPSSSGICYTVTRLPGGGSRRVNTNGAWNQVEGPHLLGCKEPYLPLEARSDTLVFCSAPLEADLTIAGHPCAELWISSSAPDTDFVVRLVDQYPPSESYPAGFALAIAEGVQRAKFRNGYEAPELLTPSETTLVRVRLRPVANRFRAGHRVRLEVTSSAWPHYDPNTHTGRNPATDWERHSAVNTIHLGGEQASVLVLPVV
jgi:uncharacterized protein